MKLLFASLFAGLVSLFSCQQKSEGYESLSVDAFADLLLTPRIQCLDVRTVAEYSEGHIPGSINLNVLDEAFASMADSTLQKEDPVALYCRSGKRSKKAASILSRKGYKVYELNTGFNGWLKAEREVER